MTTHARPRGITRAQQSRAQQSRAQQSRAHALTTGRENLLLRGAGLREAFKLFYFGSSTLCVSKPTRQVFFFFLHPGLKLPSILHSCHVCAKSKFLILCCCQDEDWCNEHSSQTFLRLGCVFSGFRNQVVFRESSQAHSIMSHENNRTTI